MQECSYTFSDSVNKKGIEFITIFEQPKLLVNSDVNILHKVLCNVIDNSIKYTNEGKVEIIVSETPSYAIIKVQDTGIGIPQEDIDRIFERFYRVDKARSKAVGGTGLGLAIVKHIIDAHSSKIIVESVFGKGSRFSFKLKK